MDNPTTIALSRMVAQSRAMDVTATNIANSGTPGFRAERTVFSDWLVKSGAGGPKIAYTQDRATYRDTARGPVTPTGNPLDLSIGADGYFTVETAQGPRLTRSGHFELSATGAIVDSEGNALLDAAGQKLQLAGADTRITIAADGTISSENGQIGRIGVVTPTDANKLRAEGARLFDSGSPTQPVAAPRILQGSIESSNVQPTLELTRMMNDMREFQFTSQFIQAEADRQQGAIDKILQKRG